MSFNDFLLYGHAGLLVIVHSCDDYATKKKSITRF